MLAVDRDLHAFAVKLCKCYQYHRNSRAQNYFHGSYRVPPCFALGTRARGTQANKNSVWHKLARFCQIRHIDPLLYIQWSLHCHQLALGPSPEPNHLLLPKKMDTFRANLPKLREHLFVRLFIEMRHAKAHVCSVKASGMSARNAWANVLTTSGLDLSPLYRHCRALNIGGPMLQRVADYYEQMAFMQYQSDPVGYALAWQDLIPQHFAERAQCFYDQVLAQEP